MSGVSQQPHPATHITDHQSWQRMFAVLFTIQRIQIFGHLSTKFKCPRFQQRERASSKHCEHFTNFVVASSTHHRSPWLPPTGILAKTCSLEPRCPLLVLVTSVGKRWQLSGDRRGWRKTGGNLGSGPAVTANTSRSGGWGQHQGPRALAATSLPRAVSGPLSIMRRQFPPLQSTTFPLWPVQCVLWHSHRQVIIVWLWFIFTDFVHSPSTEPVALVTPSHPSQL